MGGRGERGVREGATAWLEARGQSTRVPGFQAVHGDAGLGRGAGTSSAGRQQHLPCGFHQAWGLGCARSRALLLTPATPAELPGQGALPCPSGELEAGGPAFPLLTSPLLCAPRPGLATVRAACLHSWLPPATRGPFPTTCSLALPGTHWGCFQAPVGSSPGFCPGHQGPAPGPAEAPRWGLETGQQG